MSYSLQINDDSGWIDGDSGWIDADGRGTWTTVARTSRAVLQPTAHEEAPLPSIRDPFGIDFVCYS
jgi:hypothetical protein